jgi:epoxyqueuosine reductase
LKASPPLICEKQTHAPNSRPPSDKNSSLLIEKASCLGFVAIGFSRPERPVFFDRFCSWISAGRHGVMEWLARTVELRESPLRLLDGCRTVVSLAYPYSSLKPITPDGYRAARYTEPEKEDYHNRLRRLGKELAREIIERYPGSKSRVCVDSAPIMERSFAYCSGIGFIGKNNMFIIPGHGSYVFLVEILTTASLAFPEIEPMNSQCGSCGLCIDACPTGALGGPFSLDASKCLSYLTIERPEAVDRETGEKMGKCFFGCDICQEVCPFTEGGSAASPSLPSTEEILAMGAADFGYVFGKTAFARAGLEKLKTNIRAVRQQDQA